MTKAQRRDDGMWHVAVGDHEYAFSKWGAEQALDTLWDIGSIVSAPVGAALAQAFGKGGAGMKTEITPDMASQVLGELTANMRTNKAVALGIIKKMTSGDSILCDGRKVVFDRHYEIEGLPHAFQVLRAAFEVQYGDFFAASSAAAKLRGADAAAQDSAQARPTAA